VVGGYPITGITKIAAREIFGAANWKNLCTQYGDECSLPEVGRIDPQPETYDRMEQSGALQCFGAFAGDALMGFAAVLIYVAPHYGKKIASVESLFVDKRYRRTVLGLGLLIKVERYAKEQQCAAVGYSAPSGSILETLMSRRKKFRRTNSVWMRSLT
jgi:GNAT superfamily N-acetyltransferase